jgi:flagellar biosynthesis protein FlhF
MKRYLAPDMRTALRQIRIEQGPEAVILSTRQLPDGVEVCAAIDAATAAQDATSLLIAREPPAPAAAPAPAPAAAPASVSAPAPALAAPAVAVEAPAHPAVAAVDPIAATVQEELRGLRRLLEQQLAALAWNDYTRREPAKAQALIELAELGVGRDIAQDIVAAFPAGTDAGTTRHPHLALLARRLHTAPMPGADGGRIALVGPSGAGKTTTLAKLAARWVLEHEPESLVLMSVDDVRIGGGEQLKVLGRLLGVAVDVVAGPAELARRLASRAHARLVLIDTPGLAARAADGREGIEALRAALPALELVAVLPASAQAVVLEDCARRLRALDPTSVILTRVDEAASLGGALSALLRSNLPVSLVCDGPGIPEDLRPARAHQLVARAAELARASGASADEDLLAHRFGGHQHAAA